MISYYLSSTTGDHAKFAEALQASVGTNVAIGWTVPMHKCEPAVARGFLFQAFLKYNEGPSKPSAGYTILPSIIGSDVHAILLAMFPPGEFDHDVEELQQILGYKPEVVPVRPD